MSTERRAITELTDILDQDIETIVALRMSAERKVSYHQRAIERVTCFLGRPFSVYLILLLIVFWILVSLIERHLGWQFVDAPPFPWLQDLVSISALLMTVVVLTKQNRQEQLIEQRRHLDLQISLLTERKVSKIIALLNDMRHDLPEVRDHDDPEAQVMKEPIDPHSALSALNQTLQQAAQELE